MRDIKYIVVHCSATKPSMDIGAAEIKKWHVENNGWSDIGYHKVIRRSGDVENGRNEEVPGAHARGYNSNSIGVCLVGGIDDNGKSDANFTLQQYISLADLLDDLLLRYPNAKLLGHRDISTKDCPCFDVKAFL